MKYVATINVPGYLPTDDDPPVFDTPAEAWQYLADERQKDEDANCDVIVVPVGEEWSETVRELDTLASTAGVTCNCNGCSLGTVYGDTPGYEGDHDLGLAYSVSETPE